MFSSNECLLDHFFKKSYGMISGCIRLDEQKMMPQILFFFLNRFYGSTGHTDAQHVRKVRKRFFLAVSHSGGILSDTACVRACVCVRVCVCVHVCVITHQLDCQASAVQQQRRARGRSCTGQKRGELRAVWETALHSSLCLNSSAKTRVCNGAQKDFTERNLNTVVITACFITLCTSASFWRPSEHQVKWIIVVVSFQYLSL